MTSLITGASGFLGGRLTQVLVQRGEAVRILARPSSDLAHLEGLPLRVVRGDLSDLPTLQQAVRGVSHIYHCAARSSDWGTWDAFYAANVQGVRNLLQAALAQDGLQRFVHVSTTDVYGYPERPCDENFPLTDIGLPYNRTKILGEQAVWQAHQQDGLPLTVIRPVTIYGPRDKNFVLEFGELLRQRSMPYFNGGATHAGLIYVDNAVEGILQAAHSPRALGQAYNLRDDHDVTWRQYIQALAGALSLQPPSLNLSGDLALVLARLMEAAYTLLRLRTRPLLTRHAVYFMIRDQGYSIAKAKQDLDLQPGVAFEQGLERSAAWLKQHWA